MKQKAGISITRKRTISFVESSVGAFNNIKVVADDLNSTGILSVSNENKGERTSRWTATRIYEE